MDQEAKKTYDAVIFGAAHQRGATHHARVNKACDLVEPYLGGPAFISDVGGRSFFARRDPDDKLNFAQDHDLAMQCRYTWEDGPGGLKLGTKRPEAKA